MQKRSELLFFVYKDGENLNFAVPINYLRGLLGSIDKSRPVTQWKKAEGSSDLFSEKTTQSTSRWKSITSGAEYIVRFQSEYIYLERQESNDNRKLGVFWTAEVKKNGEQYSGTVHYGAAWWSTNLINGERYVTDKCTANIPMELSLVSPLRIQGRTLGPPAGAKLDKKKCTFSGKPAWNEFVLIPE